MPIRPQHKIQDMRIVELISRVVKLFPMLMAGFNSVKI